jgi:hypothetical protein
MPIAVRHHYQLLKLKQFGSQPKKTALLPVVKPKEWRLALRHGTGNITSSSISLIQLLGIPRI